MKLEERQRLHALSIADLNKELGDAEGQLLTYRFDAGLNRLSNPAGLHNTRKLIAVLKTIIREKELLSESGFNSMTEYKTYKVAERASYKASKS